MKEHYETKNFDILKMYDDVLLKQMPFRNKVPQFEKW